jgi:hypothetical protein
MTGAFDTCADRRIAPMGMLVFVKLDMVARSSKLRCWTADSV